MGTVNQEKQLERIADALEGINSSLADVAEMLESIDQKISGCISHSSDGDYLCITGNVSNY